jgi:uncharacterized membrane protein
MSDDRTDGGRYVRAEGASDAVGSTRGTSDTAPGGSTGLVSPTRDDPLLRLLSRWIGGPAGARVVGSRGFWSPQRLLIVMLGVTFTVALLIKAPCHSSGWPRGDANVWMCYSDIPYMFRERGLASGAIPYFDHGPYQPLEYPVLIGAIMWFTSVIARTAATTDAAAVRFFDVNAILLLGAALTTLIATIRLAGRRPYDAALFALAPTLALSGLSNWDLIAISFMALAMLAWARRRPGWAGVALGHGVSTKLYPILLLGPLLLLCLRAKKMAEFWRLAGTTIATWVVINLPVFLFARDGWLAFWRFNEARLGDFGSIFYLLTLHGHELPAGLTNWLILLIFGAGCAFVAWLALVAPTPPRLAALAFLVVAAFCLANKVYSPQYVLWLVPLAALARPRWRDFLIWQGCEVVYWIAIWLFLGGRFSGTGGWIYDTAVVLHIGGTLYFAAMVVRDVIDPRSDPVRASGEDDPAFPWRDALPYERDRRVVEPGAMVAEGPRS